MSAGKIWTLYLLEKRSQAGATHASVAFIWFFFQFLSSFSHILRKEMTRLRQRVSRPNISQFWPQISTDFMQFRNAARGILRLWICENVRSGREMIHLSIYLVVSMHVLELGSSMHAEISRCTKYSLLLLLLDCNTTWKINEVRFASSKKRRPPNLFRQARLVIIYYHPGRTASQPVCLFLSWKSNRDKTLTPDTQDHFAAVSLAVKSLDENDEKR